MTDGIQLLDKQHIKQQLDTLEIKGRQHLVALAHRSALERAWQLCWPILSLMPLCLLVTGFFLPIALVWQLLLAVFTPVLAFVVIYYWQVRHYQVSRHVSLSYLERTLNLQERLTSADEFCRLPLLNAFSQAALDEAQPFIAKAQQSTITKPQLGKAQLTFTQWPLALLAGALLAAAISWQAMMVTSITSTTVAEHTASALQDVLGAIPIESSLLVITAATRQATLAVDQTSNDNVAADMAAQHTNEPSSRQPQVSSPPDIMPAAGAATPPQSALPHSNDAAGAQSSKTSNAAPASKQAESEKTSEQEASQRSGQTGNADTAMNNEAAENSGQGQSDAEGETSENEQATQTPQSSTNAASDQATPPPVGTQKSPTPPQNNSEQQQNNRSQKGEQGQSQQGQNSNDESSQNGQPKGNDSLKKTRGVSGLLLAVPMEDQLTGTLNNGRVTTVTRQTTPQEQARVSDRSPNQGVFQGTLGEQLHRVPAAWEQKLVRDVFMRQQAAAETSEQTNNQ